jgi:hypothetical protein
LYRHGVRISATACLATFLLALTLSWWTAAGAEPAAVDGAPAAAEPGKTPCTPQPNDLKPLAAATAPTLVPFKVSPFPYDRDVPAEHKKFLDYDKDGHRGHTSPRGNLHLEEEAYSNKNSLLYLPKGFDLSRPEQALIVVFFHGNYVELLRDVAGRQRIPQQLAESGLNAALVAPQFAVGIPDSSAGWFWQPEIFRQYLGEAAHHLAVLHGGCTEAIFDRLRVVLVAYSGGYDPAAYVLDVGGANERLRGVVLLDALYGEIDKFEHWIDHRGTAFFLSAYSDSSRAENTALRGSLTVQSSEINPRAAWRLSENSVQFLYAGPGIDHKNFMTLAWARNPLIQVLSAIDGYAIDRRYRNILPSRPKVAATPPIPPVAPQPKPTAHPAAPSPQPPRPGTPMPPPHTAPP